MLDITVNFRSGLSTRVADDERWSECVLDARAANLHQFVSAGFKETYDTQDQHWEIFYKVLGDRALESVGADEDLWTLRSDMHRSLSGWHEQIRSGLQHSNATAWALNNLPVRWLGVARWVIEWSTKNGTSWEGEIVLAALPCSTAALQRLAARSGWCSTWDGAFEAAQEAGITDVIDRLWAQHGRDAIPNQVWDTESARTAKEEAK